uniref:Uncharacterized protein n=1 Tax=Cyprinus carpio carpio TaxID=630221 RepID=A0A9J7X4W1_CYPCA
MRLDAENGIGALAAFDQPLPIRALQWDALEQNHHHQVQTPDFICLPQTINAPHLPLLVRVREDATWRLLPCDGQHKVLPTLWPDVFAELGEEARCPLLFDLGLFAQELILDGALFVLGHPFLVLFEILALTGLQVEPGVGEGTHMRQQRLDERMEFILGKKRKKDIIHVFTQNLFLTTKATSAVQFEYKG